MHPYALPPELLDYMERAEYVRTYLVYTKARGMHVASDTYCLVNGDAYDGIEETGLLSTFFLRARRGLPARIGLRYAAICLRNSELVEMYCTEDRQEWLTARRVLWEFVWLGIPYDLVATTTPSDVASMVLAPPAPVKPKRKLKMEG